MSAVDARQARTVGVLGGGQLGRMLALAGYPLGISCRFLDPAEESPAGQVADCLRAPWADAAGLERFAAGLDVATFEFENVPVAAVQALAARVPVHPRPAALLAKQDRLDEKRFLRGLGVPTAPFAEVSSRAQLDAAVAAIGLPAVLKTRRDGYDGKGQAVLRAPADLDPAWARLGAVPLILEGFIPFERECSLLAVRGHDGAVVCYPLAENVHRGGILHRSLVPATGAAELTAEAERHARAVLAALDYVGVLAIEFFVHAGGLLANEMAPRVHNSGHWTQDGAVTSQFENHLRAICGLPLGDTALRGAAAMVNLVGAIPDPAAILAIPGAKLHLYGKTPRPGRKVGHVNVCAADADGVLKSVARIEALLEDAGVAPQR